MKKNTVIILDQLLKVLSYTDRETLVKKYLKEYHENNVTVYTNIFY